MPPRCGSHGDDIHLAAQTFLCQLRKPVMPTGRGEVVDSDGLAVHIAQLAQTLEERLPSWLARLECAWIECKETQPRHSLYLLRPGSERCGEEAARQATEERPPVHHSIT